MTQYRGYKKRTSKYGVEPISVEETKTYGKVIIDDMLVREFPDGNVIEILKKNDKVEILEKVDSKWVQVTTPSGRVGVAGSQNIMEE